MFISYIICFDCAKLNAKVVFEVVVPPVTCFGLSEALGGGELVAAAKTWETLQGANFSLQNATLPDKNKMAATGKRALLPPVQNSSKRKNPATAAALQVKPLPKES